MKPKRAHLQSSGVALKAPRRIRLRAVSEPLGGTVDGDVPYRSAWSGGVPPESGVYLIRDLRGLLYVGRTENLGRRFHQHLAGSHNELLARALQNPWGEVSFAWIVHSNPGPLEARLIELLIPLCNERR